MRYRLGLNPVQRLLFGRGEVGPRVLEVVEHAMAQRLSGLPLAYVLECSEFDGLVFHITPDVLIPRDDTEWLVRRASEWIRGQRNRQLSVLDLGCGSGCVGLALARRHPEITVTLSDVSSAAVEVTRLNAQRLGVEERCVLRTGDWFASLGRRERFNAIVCNPPYITRQNDPQLSPAVRQNEPSLALFLQDDPQEFFFRLARKAVSHLQSGGLFAVEVGYDTAWPARCAFEQVNALTRGHEVHDFHGLERVIWGIRK